MAIEEDVQTDRIILRDGAGRTIHLRSRMNWGTKQRVSGAAWQRANVRGDRSFSLDDYNIALVLFNVLSWSGPGFDSVPITADGIISLEADTDEMIEHAFTKVGEINAARSDSEEKKD